MKKLFYNISKLYGTNNRGTFKSGAEMQQLNEVENAWILVENGKIAAIGNADSEMPSDVMERIDLLGAEVLPGFVDSHTHIVFAAPRHEEFAMRLAGASYEEIAANGGGILNSARKLQAMSEDELYNQAAERLKLMLSHGTTPLKSKVATV
jgi:imidazolonepropionase